MLRTDFKANLMTMLISGQHTNKASYALGTSIFPLRSSITRIIDASVKAEGDLRLQGLDRRIQRYLSVLLDCHRSGGLPSDPSEVGTRGDRPFLPC